MNPRKKIAVTVVHIEKSLFTIWLFKQFKKKWEIRFFKTSNLSDHALRLHSLKVIISFYDSETAFIKN